MLATLNLSYWITVILEGVVYGTIYGLFGTCFVLIFRSNHIFNLSLMQFITLIILTIGTLIKKGFPFLPTLALGVFVSFFLGAGLHIGAMRYATERRKGSHHKTDEMLLTVGLLAIFDGLSNFLFNSEPSSFPSIFGAETVPVLGLNISRQSIGIIVFAWLVLGGIFAFFRYSTNGLKMEAVAENITAARLRGINASNILACSWGIATALGTVACALIAPIVFVYPQMLANIFSYSLIAVVIGGLESTLGAIVGGIAIGVVENVGAQLEFIGSDLKFFMVFLLLLLVLIVRPTGIWGRKDGRRV